MQGCLNAFIPVKDVWNVCNHSYSQFLKVPVVEMI